MADLLVAILDDVIVGELFQGERGELTFRYANSWRFGDNPTPLSLSMPLTIAEHSGAAVNAFVWGLLPDNEAVLHRWAQDFQVSPRNPFSLLRYVGDDCAGAVRFVLSDNVMSGRRGDIEWLDVSDVGDRLCRLRQDPAAWHGGARTGQFSLAGGQPKIALRFEDGKWGIPGGSEPTTHILKPGIDGIADHHVNEHLCLRTAQALAIPASHSSIESFAGETAVVVERFDRFRLNGIWLRIHQEDFCQALAVHPTQRYENEGGPSALDVCKTLRNFLPYADVEGAIGRFIDALLYNWLIAGTDAHAKNYSLLLTGGDVTFAPLYDLASSLVLPDVHIRDLKMAMKIGGEYRLHLIGLRHWRRVANDFGIDEMYVVDRARTLARDLPEALHVECAALKGSDAARRLLEVVSDRAEHCQRMLA